MPADRVDDDELLLLRVPPWHPWFEPPDRISSANFKLDRRRNDQGLSVYRNRLVTAADVLGRPEAPPGSLVVCATAGEVRALINTEGKPLHLDVIADDDRGQNPGHAEIRGPEPGKLSGSATRALQKLFRRFDGLLDERQP